MPILDLQKRARELGRIRTGAKAGNGAPTKLSKFRLTSASRPLLEKVAALYGGEVREWTPAGGTQQWEVYTSVDRIPIYIPQQPVSQWYEAWTAGGCVHRCDGETDYITGEACDPTDPAGGHQDAKPTTRLNVILCEVEGIGFWRLESHGWNAAVELPQAAEFLAQANGMVEGWLSLEERVSKTIKDGKPQTRKFLVPIIEIGVTPAQLMSGQGRVQAPSVEGPVERKEIEAPKTDPHGYLPQAQQCSTVEAVQAIWWKAKNAGHMTDQLEAELKVVADALEAAVSKPPAAEPDSEGVYDADVVDDPEAAAAEADMAWQRILTVAGQQGLSLTDTQAAYAEFSGGVEASTASAAELQAFLQHLENAQVPA